MSAYSQQMIAGSYVGFRNSDEEDWIRYEVKPGEAVLMISPDGKGYAPWPHLKPVTPTDNELASTPGGIR